MNLQVLIDELTEVLRATVGPEFEGFENLELLDIKPDSKAQVNFDINRSKRAHDLVAEAIKALSALLADGYPYSDDPRIDVPPLVYDDLVHHGASIDAALRRYRKLPPMAVGGVVTLE